jgi:2-polyprenyl-3-methyl-5-hydroxy-6-metoxy-1,4-benzoquinol methylase
LETSEIPMRLTDNPYHQPMGSPERRAQYEYRLALDFILPHLSRWGVDVKNMRVLDLGCGTGGITVALAEIGADCVGIDLNPSHIAQAVYMAEEHGVKANFVSTDALKFGQLEQVLKGRVFDLVILSEFLEHLVNLQNVSSLLDSLREYLYPGGYLYVSFPPWFNPFGGHQAGWPVIRSIPWFHIIPHRLKRVIAPKHARQYLEFFQELNHLTIGSFENMTKETKLTVVHKELFHFRPEFYWRYGVPTVRSSILGRIPILREVTTTGAFYLLAKA